MTFEELVKKVAVKNGMTFTRKGTSATEQQLKSLRKVQSIIKDALNIAADEAKNGIAPKFPGIGRFVMKPVRSTGRKTDGTVWTKPGRTRLALVASIKRGGLSSSSNKLKPASSVAA